MLFNLVTDGIEIVEKQDYEHCLKEANKLIGKIDKGDVPFLALALSAPNNGIWTENARHFEFQKKVKIWTTKALLARVNFK
jgi:predicted nucleic acid-binding protein